MKCDVCGGYINERDHLPYCSECSSAYNDFCENLPEEWVRITGGMIPEYDDYLAERRIKKMELDGTISHAEAKSRASVLAEELRIKYNPTSEDIINRINQNSAKQTQTIYSAPSLFD